jgi:hypothetical protein
MAFAPRIPPKTATSFRRRRRTALPKLSDAGRRRLSAFAWRGDPIIVAGFRRFDQKLSIYLISHKDRC